MVVEVIHMSGFWYAMAILFWVVIALLACSFIVDTLVKFEYYRWDREARELERIGNVIDEKLDELCDNMNDGQ